MRLYVGNIPWETNESQLEALFEQYGTVTDAKVITDRETGRSKGFAFVEVGTDAEGQKAIGELHNSDYNGRTIVVNVAKPKEGKSNGPARHGENRGRDRDERGGGRGHGW